MSELHCYQVLYVQCMCTTFVHYEGVGDSNNYAANIIHRHIKFSHLGGQMAQTCAPNLTKSIQEAVFICLLLLATVEFL